MKKTIWIGSDHAGVDLKNTIKNELKQEYDVQDVGPLDKTSVDYPDFGEKVAMQVSNHPDAEGILICGSGIGMSITANKVPGIRAALVHSVETATLARQHNNANILCLGARMIPEDQAVAMVKSWLTTTFEGDRHQKRIDKISTLDKKGTSMNLKEQDSIIEQLIQKETKRQGDHLEMIASENFVSPAVLEAMGSTLTNKYAEGYPGKRYYSGCEVVDEVESIAIDRAKKIFGADYVNVQPHSGSQANMAVYMAVLEPGDKVLAMNLAHGGHLTHGSPVNFSGKLYDIIPYGVTKEDQRIDYNEVADLAKKHKPKMIICGASAYPRIIDFKKFREIADSIGAYLFADMAHIAGLVATGHHPSPIPHCHFVTTTTHKTLRGPRSGMILAQEEVSKAVAGRIFPGIQGGPMMHTIAAKAVCFGEALKPSFKNYIEQVVQNAKTLSGALVESGFALTSNGTDNHLFLLDLRKNNITGKDAEAALEKAGITTNKNMVPFDDKSPFITSGVRIGTPAITTRGMKEKEMKLISNWISNAIQNSNDEQALKKIRSEVFDLCSNFPLFA